MKQYVIDNGLRKLAIGAAAIFLFLLLIPSVAFAGDSYSVKVNTGYLALRTAPAYDYSNEIGKLYTGDTVELVDTSNGQYWWVYSPKYDRSGYVNKDYLVYNGGSWQGTYRVKVAKNYLALRTAPSFERWNEVGELYTGDTVELIDKYNGTYWWVYSHKYDREGYVNKNYLVFESNYYNNDDYRVKVATGYLALRTAPAYDYSNEIGKLYTGDTVELVDTSNGQYWWVYSSKYDRSGYVNKDYLIKI